jgi:dTDP-4-amino-4,6-dideoxygalactose transaminase
MIRLVDLATQHARLRPELDAAIAGVLDRSEFVLGRPVADFEAAFAAYCGTDAALGVNSGTSALHLALLAAGVGPGDEVITTAFTFVATVAAIGYTGARPVLVDISPGSFTIDPGRIEAAITPRTRAIVPVHLYGQPADMDPILDIARRHRLAVIEDACQAHGAEYRGRRVGSLGDAGCFSFYPSKNLGACGEGGMLVTSNPEVAQQVRLLRDWGQSGPYQHVVQGFNYRMEGLQGAVLGVKLRYLEQWNAVRRANAARYDATILGPALQATPAMTYGRHVYHIYAVRANRRAEAQQAFQERGIGTRIHYPTPIHLLEAWSHLGLRAGDLPEAERAANEVLSIPVHPELSPEQVNDVIQALQAISWEDAALSPPGVARNPRRQHAAS